MVAAAPLVLLLGGCPPPAVADGGDQVPEDVPANVPLAGEGGGYEVPLDCVGVMDVLPPTDVWVGVTCWAPGVEAPVVSLTHENHLGGLTPPVTAPPDGG